jgi:hypothetical protein
MAGKVNGVTVPSSIDMVSILGSSSSSTLSLRVKFVADPKPFPRLGLVVLLSAVVEFVPAETPAPVAVEADNNPLPLPNVPEPSPT